MVSGRLGRKTYKEQYAFIYRQVCLAGAARPPSPCPPAAWGRGHEDLQQLCYSTAGKIWYR